MIVGCYSMDLYCDCKLCLDARANDPYLWRPAQFCGYSQADTVRQARKAGWKFSSDWMYCFAPGHRVTRVADRAEPGEE